jgi:hypothetical protein
MIFMKVLSIIRTIESDIEDNDSVPNETTSVEFHIVLF